MLNMICSLSSDEIHGGTLLSSLEGITDMVEWERIMDLQSQDGSFLSSPASTACVFMHTRDMKCLQFLNSVLTKFGSFGMYGGFMLFAASPYFYVLALLFKFHCI